MLTGDLRFFVANVVVRWRMTLPALSAVSLVPDVEVGVEVMQVGGLVAAPAALPGVGLRVESHVKEVECLVRVADVTEATGEPAQHSTRWWGR